jgi:hypothetical protein
MSCQGIKEDSLAVYSFANILLGKPLMDLIGQWSTACKHLKARQFLLS